MFNSVKYAINAPIVNYNEDDMLTRILNIMHERITLYYQAYLISTLVHDYIYL